MKHIGIIAEYNPFHSGHLYQLNEVKRLFPDKKIVVILSGDYVQRGEPAVYTKSFRTKCALIGGVDLVIEMPSLFASASSEFFAAAGLYCLAATGIIDTICFGAECDDVEMLYKIAKFFLSEPYDFKTLLKKHLANGNSYPKARALSLKEMFPDDKYNEIIRKPNNILAIEYIKAIIKYDLPIKPCIIKRTDDNYNSLDTTDKYCSASALRNAMITDKYYNDILEKHIPKEIFDCIINSSYGKPLFSMDFYPCLQYILLREKNNLNIYHEINDELANRINNLSVLPNSYNELIDTLSGRQITSARIRRALLNILLTRTKEDIQLSNIDKMINYIRILGARNESTHLIKQMNELCTLPIINKTSNARTLLNATALSAFNKSVSESNLYRQIFYNKYGTIIPNDYEQSVIII